MTLEPRGAEYPEQAILVLEFPGRERFDEVFGKPPGFESRWPPDQVMYLGKYLEDLECGSLVIEDHYIDRDYILDNAAFYSRSLRSPPNHCRRYHFFRSKLTEAWWKQLVLSARSECRSVQEELNKNYLGFVVVRPLPGSPVGRTVLAPLGPDAGEGRRREFQALRRYKAHLAGFELEVEGLAFQQQDRGVSACATAALWSAIHRAADMEKLAVPTPAEITEAAARYLIPGGRPLPSDGLTIHQVCEATRASGLAPLLIKGVDLWEDRVQLLGYTTSGFAPVLVIHPLDENGNLAPGDTHAVCCVGVRSGDVVFEGGEDVDFEDRSDIVTGLYLHDDRLGPYAIAEIEPHSVGGVIRTGLSIEWPEDSGQPTERSILEAIMVPVPVKLRLTIGRMRELGAQLAAGTAAWLEKKVALDCRYYKGTEYRSRGHGFGLSDSGLYGLACETVLSRWVGVVGISGESGPLFDVVLDTTETESNPAALVLVVREGLPRDQAEDLRKIADEMNATFII